MDIRKLENPTIKDSAFTYAGMERVVKAGKTESFPAEIVQFYLQHVNGPLVESTNSPAPEAPKEEPKVEEKKK